MPKNLSRKVLRLMNIVAVIAITLQMKINNNNNHNNHNNNNSSPNNNSRGVVLTTCPQISEDIPFIKT